MSMASRTTWLSAAPRVAACHVSPSSLTSTPAIAPQPDHARPSIVQRPGSTIRSRVRYSGIPGHHQRARGDARQRLAFFVLFLPHAVALPLLVAGERLVHERDALEPLHVRHAVPTRHDQAQRKPVLGRKGSAVQLVHEHDLVAKGIREERLRSKRCSTPPRRRGRDPRRAPRRRRRAGPLPRGADGVACRPIRPFRRLREPTACSPGAARAVRGRCRRTPSSPVVAPPAARGCRRARARARCARFRRCAGASCSDRPRECRSASGGSGARRASRRSAAPRAACRGCASSWSSWRELRLASSVSEAWDTPGTLIPKARRASRSGRRIYPGPPGWRRTQARGDPRARGPGRGRRSTRGRSRRRGSTAP